VTQRTSAAARSTREEDRCADPLRDEHGQVRREKSADGRAGPELTTCVRPCGVSTKVVVRGIGHGQSESSQARRQASCAAASVQRDRLVSSPGDRRAPLPAVLQRQGAERAVRELSVHAAGSYLGRWGFTPQRPIERAYEQRPEAVQQWVEHEYPAIERRATAEGAEIDRGAETAPVNSDVRDRSHAPRGKTPVARAAGGTRETLSMIPEHVRLSLHNLLTTLLAHRIGAGPGADGAALRRAMEAAWAKPLVLRRWQRVALRLTPAQCERIVETAVQRRLAGAELRCLTFEQATDGWALETAGLAMATVATPPVQQRPATPSPRPAVAAVPRVHVSQASLAF
jgi:hypothetical protein